MDVSDIIKTSGMELPGVTTEQRVILGALLKQMKQIKHILVYDIDQQAIYIWTGKEWV